MHRAQGFELEGPKRKPKEARKTFEDQDSNADESTDGEGGDTDKDEVIFIEPQEGKTEKTSALQIIKGNLSGKHGQAKPDQVAQQKKGQDPTGIQDKEKPRNGSHQDVPTTDLTFM